MSGSILGREPAVIAGAVRAIILLGVAFGLQWTAEQIAALMLAVEAVLTLLVRQNSTPTANPQLREGTTVEVITADDKPNESVTL